MNRHSHPPEHEMYALAAAVFAGGAGVYLAGAWLLAHPAYLAVAVFVVLALLLAATVGRARWRDRRARRDDPHGPGVIIGSVRGQWPLARERPYVIPWRSVLQHLLVCGPTGAGKSFTFLVPLLRAFCSRSATGVFYLDGKADRVDLPDPSSGQPGVDFDAVFCPEDPARSAHWNPLEGEDPIEAAALFAAALYPDASSAIANFYETRAVFAIRTVAPALAFAGPDPDDKKTTAQSATATPGAPGSAPAPAPAPNQQNALTDALIAAGVDHAKATKLARETPREVAEQLRWLSHRTSDQHTPEALVALIADNADPPPSALVGATLERTHPVNPSTLARALFTHGKLTQLTQRLATVITDTHGSSAQRLVLEQIRGDLHSLTQLPDRERAAMLANLQNRLSVFLRPPFLALCGHSDFQIADVCAGKRVAFLLSVGAFPDVARQLGRIALSQFKNAVLADNPDTSGTTAVEKYAVLDELHNFISADFGAFLNQARGRLGGAVMGMQSLGDFPRETVQAMLGTTRSFIVTPGVGVEDRAYFAELFGKHHVEQQSVSAPAGRLFQGDPPSSVRRELVERYRHTPTEIAELAPEYAYIRLTDRRRTYPVTRVRVERRPGARPGRARIGAPR